jgi:hypothetical protein
MASTPAELSVMHEGSALPLDDTAQFLYGGMPPLPFSWIENAAPTVPNSCVLVVPTVGAAGTVIVAVPILVASATEVAVTVTVRLELEGVGAV